MGAMSPGDARLRSDTLTTRQSSQLASILRLGERTYSVNCADCFALVKGSMGEAKTFILQHAGHKTGLVVS